jgi:hypothetical protein
VIKRHHNHDQAAQKVDRIQPASAGCIFFCLRAFFKNLPTGVFKNCLLRQLRGSPQRFQSKGHDSSFCGTAAPSLQYNIFNLDPD